MLQIKPKSRSFDIETDDPAEIEKAIARFMTDKDFYRHCRENELKNAHRYNWENEVQILSRIYE